jgi:Diiron non-heme beta-hydroxylase N-terminal domain/Beta-lactamase superfamily domain
MTSAPKARYLKPSVAFEPLVSRWYAWPFLVAPATFAMVVRNRLIPLLESFIDDPDFHRASARDPKLRGGLFVDFHGDVAIAEELLASMRKTATHQLEFAEALVLASDLLARETGASLEPLYERLPAALRGLVELGYDLNHHASLRLIEPLLYATPLYDPGLQSVFLRPLDGDARPFVLATPHLELSSGVLVNAPFSDRVFDDLAMAREQGLPETEFEELRARVAVSCPTPSRFSELFTEQAPARSYDPCPPDVLRVRYFGHATLLIEGGGTSILTDPNVGYAGDHGVARFSFQDLPPTIDYVLLTHSHQDHVLLECLLQLRHKVKTIVVPHCNGGFLQDPSLKLMLEQMGFRSVVALDELERFPVPGGAIVGLPFLGEHCDLHIKSKLGFHVELGGYRIVCLADSNNLAPELYARMTSLLAPPELVFIGMECTGGPMSWLYGDLLPRRMRREHDHSRRLSGSNFERARRIVTQLDPRGVFVYAMGAEPWMTHLTSIAYDDSSVPIVESDRLVESCRASGKVSERLFGKREIVLSRRPVEQERSFIQVS